MAVIIGDIHGDINHVKAFLAYKPEAEHIALGDYVDTRSSATISLDDELACIDLLFASDSVLLWGNHDLSYLPESPWRCTPTHYINSYEIKKYTDNNEYLQSCLEEYDDLYVRHVFEDKFVKQRHRIKAAYAVNGWLCTHAGFCKKLAEVTPPGVLEGGAEAIADWLNEEFLREMKIKQYPQDGRPPKYGVGPLFQVAAQRGGIDTYGGIFWYDSQFETTQPYDGVKQIFGHTKTEGPMRIKNWVNIHIEDGVWVYDTELLEFKKLG